MTYREISLSGNISETSMSGSLNADTGMSGSLNMAKNTADVPIHYGTTEYWNSQPELIGKKSHIYVYSDYAETEIDGKMTTVPNIKIGDGNAYLIDNPFVTTSVEDIINGHIADTVIHISKNERDFWNEKVRCYIDPENPENIIFTTD